MKMKISSKVLAIVLSVLCILPMLATTASGYAVSILADGFNKERGSGELIIYTPSYGQSTRTNDYGYELVVVDNMVTIAGPAGNNTIPENGFVLSGHDDEVAGGRRMATWLRTKAYVGDYIYYTPDGNVTITDHPLETSMFYTVSNTFHGFNLLRDADTLIIYNTLGSKTNTNDWGIEVVCEEGVISSIGGNNNTVPSKPGSFVLSGHGVMADWLLQNARLGMSVGLDTVNKKIELIFDEYSAIEGMYITIDSLWNDYNTAKYRFDNLDYNAVSDAIKKLESDVEAAVNTYEDSGDSVELSNTVYAFNAAAADVSLLICESRPVEYRAVWLRPDQKNAKDVDTYVQSLYENGINTICLETLIDSCMIMPMPEGSLFEHHPKFDGFDVLKAFIDSCHSRDMELHVWMPVFYVGDGGSANVRRSIGLKRPEWLSVSNTGRTTEVTDGYIMLDPSCKEAKEFLLESYKYIVQTYDIDSIQLDYIRYFTRTDTLDMGYTETALNEFEAIYGIRPTYAPYETYWKDWMQFRANYISDFVLQVKLMIDEVAPHVLLAADVVPDPTESLVYNYQDYSSWVDKGWLDLLFPMAYNSGYQSAIKGSVERCGNNAFSAIGLGIYMNEHDSSDMQAQVEYNTAANANGSAFFEAYHYLNKLTGKLLNKGAFRTRAITPTLKVAKAGKAQIEYTKSRINDIIVPFEGMSKEDANTLISALDALSASISKKNYSIEEYNKVVDLINELNIAPEAATRLLQDVEFAVKSFSVNYKIINADGTIGENAMPEYTGLPSAEDLNEDSDTSNGNNEEEEPKEEGCGNCTLWIILGAVAILGVGALIFLKKKKATPVDEAKNTEE